MSNWQGISEFVAVAEQQSFSKAARQLGLSVAQVSRNIAALEQQLALKLLYRSTRSVSLTAEGLLYLPHCRHLVSRLAEANRAMANLTASLRGLLKVTAPVFYGETRLSPLLNRFLQRYPELELELVLTNDKLDLVQGGFDLALRLGQLSDSNLIGRRLGSRRQYLVASPAYLAQHGTPQALADLEQHQCLIGTVNIWRFAEQQKTLQFRPRGRLQCNSGLVLKEAALCHLGLAQLPDYYISEELANGSLVEVLAAYRQPDDGIWALYPQNRHLSAKVRQLVDYLAAELAR